MFPRIRLKHILFGAFTLIASLPVLFLAAWVQQSALAKEVSSVVEKHLLIARNLTGDLERYVLDVESSLTLVAKNLTDNSEMDGVPEFLDSLYLRRICITSNDATILKQVTAKTRKPIEKFTPDIKELLLPLFQKSQTTFGTVVYSDLVRTGEDETSFYLVKALPNLRFAVGVLTTTHIIEAQKKVSFGRRGHAAIVDRTGRAIAHPVPEWVKTMKDMSFLPPVQKMKLGETGVSQFFTPAMQADMVAGFTTVPRSGWGVMVPQPFEELQERAHDVRLMALAIALIGITVAGLIGWYIAGILSEPIQAVVDATELGAEESRAPLATAVSMTRSFIPHELRVLLTSFDRMTSKINGLTSKLHSRIDLANAEVKHQNELLQQQSLELQRANKQLEMLSSTDALTQLYNRRFFDETLGKEIAYAQRQGEAFSLIMIDLDQFKRINDVYGHAAGDKVLVETANAIRGKVRQSDVVCRLGGEEFAIVLRNVSESLARNTAENLRNNVERTRISVENISLSVTASIGIVTYSGDPKEHMTADDLYRFADFAMYHSKNSGGNRITHYSEIAHLQPARQGNGSEG